MEPIEGRVRWMDHYQQVWIDYWVDQLEARGGFDFGGAEGGGLWFERRANGKLELVDYDGMFALPLCLLEALASRGFDCSAMIKMMGGAA